MIERNGVTTRRTKRKKLSVRELNYEAMEGARTGRAALEANCQILDNSGGDCETERLLPDEIVNEASSKRATKIAGIGTVAG